MPRPPALPCEIPMNSPSPLLGKKICVTGGAGFLGSFLLQTLERRGCREIFVPRIEDYDLTTTAGVERLFTDARPEVVFHLAAVPRFQPVERQLGGHQLV